MMAKRLLLSWMFLFSFLLCTSSTYTVNYKNKKIHKELAKSSDNVITLNPELYDIVTGKPRNYSVIVLLTALSPEIGCTACKEIDPEFRLLAKSFLNSGSNYPLYFASLDYRNGREIYARLGLQSAPSVYYFPPTEGSHARNINGDFEPYDLVRRSIKAEDLASFLASKIQEPVQVKRPVNYTLLGGGVILLLGLLSTAKLVARSIIWLTMNKKIWALLSLATILLMTSGFMWNHIRNPPYVGLNKNGNIEYIAGGFQQQLGIETQISAVLHGFCAFSIVALVVYGPTIASPHGQKFVALGLISTLVVAYSIIMLIFRMKSPGYPFKLLF